MGNLGEVSSKILRANAGESAQVTLKGNGCALLLVVRKL
jgi:hypothetical protein